jgi:predicted transglutaminase-like protease
MSMANMKSYFEYRSLPYNIQNYLKQKQMKWAIRLVFGQERLSFLRQASNEIPQTYI